MRFMPVEGVCYAGLEDISKLGKKVLAEHFPTGNDVPETTVSRTCETYAGQSRPSLVQDPFREVQHDVITCSLASFTSTGQVIS